MKTSALKLLVALCLIASVIPQLKAEDKGRNDDKRRDDDTEINRILTGLKISPVRVNLRGKNIALVGLGSYLVNAAGACNDCHTNPPFEEGGNPFQGQPEKINKENFLAGGVAFGPFTSRNITPDANGLPAGLTFAQFKKTIRTGVDPDQLHPEISPLLQVMPWPVYRQLSDHDLRAMYEYLRSIPHAEPGTAAPAAARQTQ
jgi:cytochrome c553